MTDSIEFAKPIFQITETIVILFSLWYTDEDFKNSRALLRGPLFLSRRSTLELQNPVMQCMFG